MSAGCALPLMDGSNSVDGIKRWHQQTKMPDPVWLIAFACVDGDVHETIGHVNAAFVAARISPDNPQAEGFFVKRAELLRILRAYSDVSNLHFVQHKFLLSGRISRRLDNKTTDLSTKNQTPKSERRHWPADCQRGACGRLRLTASGLVESAPM